MKVLLRPSQWYAVTAAGGEQMEWTVVVRDTWTGESKTYFKEFGELAVPVDTFGFQKGERRGERRMTFEAPRSSLGRGAHTTNAPR